MDGEEFEAMKEKFANAMKSALEWIMFGMVMAVLGALAIFMIILAFFGARI